MRVGPTSPGTALTLFTSDAQSEPSKTRSLSSSGSTQSAMPSASVSGKPLSTMPLQSSSAPLQVSVEGGPGVQVCGTPLTQVCTLLWQTPVPQVTRESRFSSTAPSQSSSSLLQDSVAPGWMEAFRSLQSTLNGKVSPSVSWQTSPWPLASVSTWSGLATAGQLSQASPTPSWSCWSDCPVFATRGQLSSMSLTPSPSLSRGDMAQGLGFGTSQAPGGLVEPRHPSPQELMPLTR